MVIKWVLPVVYLGGRLTIVRQRLVLKLIVLRHCHWLLLLMLRCTGQHFAACPVSCWSLGSGRRFTFILVFVIYVVG